MTRSFPQKDSRHSTLGFIFLLLYSVALFIRPQEWSFTADTLPVARFFLMLAFFFFLVSQKPKMCGYQGLFLIGIALIIPISGLRNYDFMGGVNDSVDFIIYSVIPFLLFSSLLLTEKRQRLFFLVLVVACAIMMHHGISQKMSPEGMGWSGELLSQGTRITYLGFFNDPNDLGMFFLMNIPILFYLKGTSSSFIIKLVAFVMIFLLIYGVYLTNSRGTLVGLMAMIYTYMFFTFGKTKTIIAGAVLAPAAYFAMTLFRAIDSQEQSANDRIQAWYEGVQYFKYRPLFGIGKGEFVQSHGLTAHNSYVLMWAELGTLSYLLWFAAIYLTLFMLFKGFSLKKEKYSEAIQRDIFLSKCLFFSFMGFLSTAFFLSRTYIVFLYIFLGLGVAVFYRLEKNVDELQTINWKQEVMRAFGLGLLSLIGLYFIIIILL